MCLPSWTHRFSRSAKRAKLWGGGRSGPESRQPTHTASPKDQPPPSNKLTPPPPTASASSKANSTSPALHRTPSPSHPGKPPSARHSVSVQAGFYLGRRDGETSKTRALERFYPPFDTRPRSETIPGGCRAVEDRDDGSSSASPLHFARPRESSGRQCCSDGLTACTFR